VQGRLATTQAVSKVSGKIVVLEADGLQQPQGKEREHRRVKERRSVEVLVGTHHDFLLALVAR
jgi:hypothetical protein